MNVNPFSYLIEKLKGKVDKSGDTMSGGLKVTAGGLEVCGRVYNSGDDEGIVVKPASNNLAGLILGSNNGKRSVFYCRTAAATAPEWNYVDGNNNSSVIYHPAKSGTIALTSDLEPSYSHSGLTYTNSSYSLGGYATLGNLVLLNLRISVTVTDSTVKPYVTLPNVIRPSFAGSLALLAENASDDEPPIYAVISGGDIYLKGVVANKNYSISGMWLK